MAAAMNLEERNKILSFLCVAMAQMDEGEEFMLEEFASDSHEEENVTENLIMPYKSFRDDKVKIGNYAEVTIGLQFSCQWKTAFRMTSTTIEVLCQKIAPYLRLRAGFGRQAIPLEKMVLVTLFYLAHQDQYRLIGDRFDLSESTAHGIVMEICSILRWHLFYEYVKWPNEAKQIEISDFYDTTKGLPGCIGSIDATHIQIPAPAEYECDYYNRKQVHSIILQATCDMELMFTSVDAGFPGRSHDSRVFKNSDLYVPPGQSIRHLVCRDEFYIVGDCGYGILSYLITPFRNTGHMTDDQKALNRKLSGVRSTIERAFGRLKGRYKRLKYVAIKDPDTAKIIVTACCVLHNFCIKHNDFFDGLDEPIDHDGNNNLVTDPDVMVSDTGAEKRQFLMRNMRR